MSDFKEKTAVSVDNSVVTAPVKKEVTRAQQLKSYIAGDGCMDSLVGMMGEENAKRFSQNVVSLYTNPNSVIKNCDPKSVIHSAMVAAYTDLSLEPNLGQAALIPFKGVATFQVMKNGFIQLAHRTGALRRMAVNPYYQGDIKFEDRFRNYIEFNMDNTDREYLEGYIAMAQLTSGYEAYVKMTIEELIAYGKRYSESFRYGKGLWVHPEGCHHMYAKTVVKKLIKHNIPIKQYEPESFRMALALKFDQSVPSGINILSASPDYVDGVNIEEIEMAEVNSQVEEAFSAVKSK